MLLTVETEGCPLLTVETEGWPLLIVKTEGWPLLTVETEGWPLLTVETEGWPLLTVETEGWPLLTLETEGWPLLAVETEGWPLLAVETEVNGDSQSTNERNPSLVGSLGLSCQSKGFCSALAALSGQVQNIVFLTVHRTKKKNLGGGVMIRKDFTVHAYNLPSSATSNSYTINQNSPSLGSLYNMYIISSQGKRVFYGLKLTVLGLICTFCVPLLKIFLHNLLKKGFETQSNFLKSFHENRPFSGPF